MRTTDEHADVVVVGAGLAGLTASRDLAEAGLRVTCLEARDRVGGRALSRSVAAGHVDLGPTWFWPGESAIEQLVADLEVPVFKQHLAGDTLIETDDGSVRRVRGNPIDVTSSRFSDGAQSLAERLRTHLPSHASLRLDAVVESLKWDSRDVLVRSRTRGHTAHEIAARAVVMAIPPALAVRVVQFDPPLPREVHTAAAGTPVWMGSVVKAVAVYEQAFWRSADLAGTAISYRGPFREFHDMSGPGGQPAALFGFAAADQFVGRAADIADSFVEQLMRLFGEQAARPTDVQVVDWSTDRWTSPAMTTPPVSGGLGHPALRRLHRDSLAWASTEVAGQYAGHLEGAVRAGQHAAALLLQRLAVDGGRAR